MPSPCDQVYPPDLRQRERELVDTRREAARVDPLAASSAGPWPDGTVGVAFSGGGIRSATFCLGVLQVLARTGLLRRVDFLSTVSGGGYAGSFLGALIARARGEGAGGKASMPRRARWPTRFRLPSAGCASTGATWPRRGRGTS